MNPKETACIFIEFQNEFCHEKGFFHSAVQKELARINTISNAQKLLESVRTKNMTIVHCPFVFDPTWYATTQHGGLLDVICKENIFQPNSWGAAFCDEMKPQPGEIVLHGKRGLSGFNNTGLDCFLKERDIKNLWICGFLTNVCVQATAFSSYDHGYQTRIVVDACASMDFKIQEYVESNICPVFGGALKTAELL